ncbi:MAG: acyltransferase [Cyanobacteria bacterium P01_E01_bin.6]
MEFTRERTNIAKGVAICLMFAHHLYAFGDRLLDDNRYIPLIPFFDAEAYIGNFGNICVSMFLFLSGYGMYLGYRHSSKKSALAYALNKLKDFYINYWRYFIIFVPVGLLFFQNVTLWNSHQLRYSTEPVLFLKNLIGWDSTYNAEWWFVRMFVVTLLLLFPLYAKLAEQNSALLILLSLFLFFVNKEVHPWGMFGFVFWQTSFACGIVCARLNLFSSELIQTGDIATWHNTILGFLLCFFFRLKVDSADYDFLIVPFFIYFSIRIVEQLRTSQLFAYLGKYSFSLWLTHSFFCYYYFQHAIYAPRWSPLVFAFLMLSSLLSVLTIEYGAMKIKYVMQGCNVQLERFRLHFKNTYRR